MHRNKTFNSTDKYSVSFLNLNFAAKYFNYSTEIQM